MEVKKKKKKPKCADQSHITMQMESVRRKKASQERNGKLEGSVVREVDIKCWSPKE